LTARQSAWAVKVAALVKGGNVDGALAQIRVAPTVKDVKDLRLLLAATNLLSKHKQIDSATDDAITALSSPRLHRSP
jgi:hypothetical protein